MQIKQLSLVLSLLLTLCLFHNTQAQQAGRIESMKLLTANVGWAATSQKLFWTTDSGARWKDITPKLNHKWQTVSSVFFLDESAGWALLHCGDGRDPRIDDVCFEFASTTNAGRNWTVVHPKIVDFVPQSNFDDWTGFSGSAFLDFADARKGWAILKVSAHVQASIGVMLRTTDGGKTWTQLGGSLPIAGNFHFVTAKDGWVAGGGQPESDLYVTRDAGDTWDRVVVKPPPIVKVETWPPTANGVWPDYELPFFETPGQGFLIGSYWDGSDATLALFTSKDLGHSWRFERVLPSPIGIATIFRGTLITASTPQNMDKLTFTRLPLGDHAAQTTSVAADLHGIPIKHHNLGAGDDALSMVDDSRGWLLADELMATADGGATWTDVTPGRAARPSGARGAQVQKMRPKGASSTRAAVSPPFTRSPPLGATSSHTWGSI
jgi:photosystem II stability/assembly factor-like uncharacterized protein